MALSYANASALEKKVADVLDDLELSLWSTTPNLASDCDTVEAANLGENQAAVAAAVRAMRNGASGLLTEEAVQAFLLPALQEMCVTIGAPEGLNADFDTACDRIRAYNVANSKTYNSRGITYGSTSAVTGTGTGTIRQLTVDDEGFRLEGCHAETKTFVCDQDQTGVEKHHEEFEIKGAVPYRDGLKRTGSGIVGRLRCRTIKDSARYISNPGFDQYSGTTQPSAGSEQAVTSTTAIDGWTLDSITGVSISLGPSDASYRDLVGVTGYTVKFAASRTISQQLNLYQNPSFLQGKPIYKQVAVYRGSSCDGTLTLTFGATTRAVSMSSLSNNAWNVVTLTLDKGLYPRNFRSNNMVISYALSSWTTGYLHLDDVVMDEMDLVDGVYLLAVGGATPFLKGDLMTIAYSEATRGVRQYWRELRSGRGRRGKFSQPSDTGGTETEVDP